MIAQRQGVSIDAVKFHLSHIMDELGLKSRAQLQSWNGIPIDSALRHGTARQKESPQKIHQCMRCVTNPWAWGRWRGRGLNQAEAHLLKAIRGHVSISTGGETVAADSYVDGDLRRRLFALVG